MRCVDRVKEKSLSARLDEMIFELEKTQVILEREEVRFPIVYKRYEDHFKKI